MVYTLFMSLLRKLKLTLAVIGILMSADHDVAQAESCLQAAIATQEPSDFVFRITQMAQEIDFLSQRFTFVPLESAELRPETVRKIGTTRQLLGLSTTQAQLMRWHVSYRDEDKPINEVSKAYRSMGSEVLITSTLTPEMRRYFGEFSAEVIQDFLAQGGRVMFSDLPSGSAGALATEQDGKDRRAYMLFPFPNELNLIGNIRGAILELLAGFSHAERDVHEMQHALDHVFERSRYLDFIASRNQTLSSSTLELLEKARALLKDSEVALNGERDGDQVAAYTRLRTNYAQLLQRLNYLYGTALSEQSAFLHQEWDFVKNWKRYGVLEASRTLMARAFTPVVFALLKGNLVRATEDVNKGVRELVRDLGVGEVEVFERPCQGSYCSRVAAAAFRKVSRGVVAVTLLSMGQTLYDGLASAEGITLMDNLVLKPAIAAAALPFAGFLLSVLPGKFNIYKMSGERLTQVLASERLFAVPED